MNHVTNRSWQCDVAAKELDPILKGSTALHSRKAVLLHLLCFSETTPGVLYQFLGSLVYQGHRQTGETPKKMVKTVSHGKYVMMKTAKEKRGFTSG